MRLSQSEVLSGIEHPSRYVRDTVADYFEKSNLPTVEVAARLIDVVQLHGWEDALLFYHRFCYFDLDEATLPWVLDQLMREDLDYDEDLSNLRAHLARMVAQTPVALLEQYRSRISQMDVFTREGRFGNDRLSWKRKIDKRIEFASLSLSGCLSRIEECCRAAARKRKFAHAEVQEAELLLEPIIAGDSEAKAKIITPRILEVLSEDQPQPGSLNEYHVGLMITLAGHLQIEEAVPLLLCRFEVDWDWYSEEIQNALVRIESDGMLDQLERYYRTAPWHARLYLTGVLEHVKSDRAVQTLLSLLEWEQADDLRVALAVGLASQFDDRGLSMAKEVYYESPEDPERREILSWLVTYAHLAEVDLPELSDWEREIASEWDRVRRSMRQTRGWAEDLLIDPWEEDECDDDEAREIDYSVASQADAPLPFDVETVSAPHETIRYAAKPVGRNDPCPCGSEKKYKKCCWRNDSAMS